MYDHAPVLTLGGRRLSGFKHLAGVGVIDRKGQRKTTALGAGPMPDYQQAFDQPGRSRAVFPPAGSPEGEIMMPDPTVADEFHIAVSVVGTTSTIGPRGEWDLAGKAAASRAVAETLQRSPDRLVLDLSRLTFMDSSAVHATIQLTERSQAEEFHFAIIPGSRAVQRIFDICHLTETLPFTRALTVLSLASPASSHNGRRPEGSGRVPVADRPPVEPSQAADRLAPTSVDSAKDQENTDSDANPKGMAQKRKMKAALDDFLRPS